MKMKKGGGQDARATVARASCPEPNGFNRFPGYFLGQDA
jgi:hypothetical protein